QRRRADDAAAVRGELRLHPGRQRAAEHGGLRHRDVHGQRLRAHRSGADGDRVRAGDGAGRHLLALARLRVRCGTAGESGAGAVPDRARPRPLERLCAYSAATAWPLPVVATAVLWVAAAGLATTPSRSTAGSRIWASSSE